jgi:cytochrome c oxidase subunit 3
MNQEAIDGRKIVSSISMIVTLISFAMLFATLMMGFAIFRFTAPVWPPQGMMKPNLIIPSLSSLSIFLSSLAFIYFEKNPKKHIGLFLTMALGLIFMMFQFIFWNSLKAQGILASSGIFGSIIYAFTWIHAAHIVVALMLLGWLILKVRTTETSLENTIANIGKFWHFLGIVWAIMFLTIFVL